MGVKWDNKMSFQGFSLLFSEKRLQDFDVKRKKGLDGSDGLEMCESVYNGNNKQIKRKKKRGEEGHTKW